jgi:uncharacterized protein (TIGR02246 family)
MKSSTAGLLSLFLIAVLAACSNEPGEARNTNDVDATSQSTGTVVEEVSQLEHAWSAAVTRRDAAALESMLADDGRFVRANGTMASKAEFVQYLRQRFEAETQNNTQCEETLESVDVQPYGEVAVTTGRYRSTCTAASAQEVFHGSFADVAVRRNGRWQLVLMAVTPVADTAQAQ